MKEFIDKPDLSAAITAVKEKLDTKVDKVEGKQLSSNDYTDLEKSKLSGIESGAQVNTITGIKGENELEYRTGEVNLTKDNIGLSEVDNTSDLDKPISTSTQEALNNKVDKVNGKQLSTEDFTTDEKNKLSGIAAGAQVNTITGVKGGAESSYRTGNVNLTPANIGAAAASHNHSTSEITDFTAKVKEVQAATILTSEPTESTVNHVVNGTTVDYKIGELVRVPDTESETGYKFYQLHNLSGGKAVWAPLGTGNSVDLTETVTITLSSNQSSSDSGLVGTRILIEDITNDKTTLLDTTWQGNSIVYKVTAATLYKVTFGECEGYQTPEAVQYTAQLSSARAISAQYNTCVLTVNISGLENGATAVATVGYGSKSFQVSSGSTIKVPFGIQSTVSVPKVSYHVTPSNQSFTPTSTTKTVSFVYVASKVKVSILSNQSNDTTISAVSATVSYGSSSVSASNGSTIYIPSDQTVTVTYPAVTGYKTPAAVTINNTSGGLATASGTYQTEVVTVTVTAEDSTSVSGQQITINGSVFTLASSGVCTTKVPYGTQYTVSANDKSGYTTPAAQVFTAAQVSRSVSMVYETIKLGVFIKDTTGKLWNTSDWTGSATANAVAVLTENVKVLVALTDSGGTKQIHSSYSGTLENYMTAISDATLAKADYKGAENTVNIMKLQSGTGYAAGWCNSFTFPDGKTKGHLPSLGEFWEVYQNKAAVDAALSKCGGTAINTSYYHWCSTFWGVDGSNRGCWILGWSDGGTNYSYLYGDTYVRAFAAYQI